MRRAARCCTRTIRRVGGTGWGTRNLRGRRGLWLEVESLAERAALACTELAMRFAVSTGAYPRNARCNFRIPEDARLASLGGDSALCALRAPAALAEIAVRRLVAARDLVTVLPLVVVADARRASTEPLTEAASFAPAGLAVSTLVRFITMCMARNVIDILRVEWRAGA